VFRLSTDADPDFLGEMLYEAVYWRDDGAEERPPLDELLARPENALYLESWGRPTDAAIVVLDRNNEPIGAAWYRRFRADAPGFGYVAADVPELAIAVYPEFRGRRLGSLMLGALIAHARAHDERGLSLSVVADNPALRLYRRHGFEEHTRDGDHITMLLTLV
jgi:ribosomal protein S18 acetylase RimI-like enzyme